MSYRRIVVHHDAFQILSLSDSIHVKLEFMTDPHADELDFGEPESGIPNWEKSFLNVVFKAGSLVLSDNSALAMFQAESDEIHRLATEDNSYDVFDPLLIPRMMGIEESSRRWSVMMVLEHLCMVNRDMLRVIESLSSGVVPRGKIDISLYKPQPDLGYETAEEFVEVNNEFLLRCFDLIRANGRLKSKFKYRHPWFGPLNAHQWCCLAAVHQRIHRRQAQKIIAMLGVA